MKSYLIFGAWLAGWWFLVIFLAGLIFGLGWVWTYIYNRRVEIRMKEFYIFVLFFVWILLPFLILRYQRYSNISLLHLFYSSSWILCEWYFCRPLDLITIGLYGIYKSTC